MSLSFLHSAQYRAVVQGGIRIRHAKKHSLFLLFSRQNRHPLKILLLYFFLLCGILAKGQDYQISLKHWGINDGLSDRQVNAILKDARGYIWLCTRNGLDCFDGYGFKVYTKEKDSLPFDCLGVIAEDASGSFWIAGGGESTSKDNLFVFDPLTRQVKNFRERTGVELPCRIEFIQKMDDSLLVFGNKLENFFFTWHHRYGLRKIQYPVRAMQKLTSTTYGTLWVQNDSAEACEIDLQGRLLRKIKTDHQAIAHACFIGSGTVFRQNEHKKNIYNRGVEVLIADGKAVLSGDPFYFDIGVDSILFGGGKLTHPKIGEIADFLKDGVPGEKTKCTFVLVESKGKIWIASNFGLYMLTVNKTKFRKYFYQDPRFFLRNSYRNLVVDGGKLYGLNQALGLMQTCLDTSKNVRMPTIPPWPAGNFALIKTKNDGLLGLKLNARYTLDNISPKWELTQVTEGMAGLQNIWSMHQLSEDSFLLGTNVGLRLFSRRKNSVLPFTNYNGHRELEQALVPDIREDRLGQVWISCNTGFYKYSVDRGITDCYSSAGKGNHFLPSKDIHHFCQDAGGIYWIATSDGLIKWDRTRGTSRLYTHNDGLSNNNICAVYDDSTGHLWLSSDHGLMRFNKTTGNVKTYLIEDGITYNEFNRASHTRDSLGNLYFGTLNGVTAFAPKDFSNEEEQSPVLAISSIEQFNGSTNRLEDKTATLIRTNTITLNPGDRFFNINIALLTYRDAIHTTYYWKLFGIDSVWNRTKDPQLRMSGLPYGNMMLHIKALSGDGKWGRNELFINIVVKKPFYLHSWFIALCVLVSMLGAYGFYRWRLARLNKENARLDSVVKEKTQTLNETIQKLEQTSAQKDLLMKEIHHRVKNNLQVIGVLLNLQLAGIKDETAKLSVEEGISRISSIALIHHQLYRGEHIAAIELSAFVSELLSQVASVYQKQEQRIELVNNVPKTWLDIDTAIPIGLILNELMTNSYKYAFAAEGDSILVIGNEYLDGTYRLTYCDNGPGLPDNYELGAVKSLGLVIIRNLSRQLGGRFAYQRDKKSFVVDFTDTATRKKIE